MLAASDQMSYSQVEGSFGLRSLIQLTVVLPQRFAPQSDDEANKGLSIIRDLLLPVSSTPLLLTLTRKLTLTIFILSLLSPSSSLACSQPTPQTLA